MRAIARDTGAVCKLSGLVTEAGAGWTTEQLKPFVDVLLEAFGPARLMWGSDWPVVNEAGGYATWRAAAEALTAQLSARRPRADLRRNRRRLLRDRRMRLSAADILPADGYAGVLVGRVWLDGGPHVVAAREDGLFDLSRARPDDERPDRPARRGGAGARRTPASG